MPGGRLEREDKGALSWANRETVWAEDQHARSGMKKPRGKFLGGGTRGRKIAQRYSAFKLGRGTSIGKKGITGESTGKEPAREGGEKGGFGFCGNSDPNRSTLWYGFMEVGRIERDKEKERESSKCAEKETVRVKKTR